MGHFIHLLHTLQGTLDSLEGNFLVNDKGDFIIDHNENFIELSEGSGPNDKGDFIIDHNENFIELSEGSGPSPAPPWGEPHVSVIGELEEYSDRYIPTYNYYCYSLTQQIYTPTEIDYTGYITGIVFYPRGTCRSRMLSVYLSATDTNAFSSADVVILEPENLVYSPKTVTVTTDTPIWLQFDTPYYYDGTTNLLVTVNDNTGTYDSSINFDIYYTSGTYQALYRYNDNYDYNPLEQRQYSDYYGPLNYKNAIQLLFHNAEPVLPPQPEVPTENYFMFTNMGGTTTLEINSATKGNVFIDDVYAGKTGKSYQISQNSVLKITGLRVTGNYNKSCLYTTNSNANFSIDRWDESISDGPSYIFSGKSGIRRVTSWNGAQNYTNLDYVFYGSNIERVDNWNNLTHITSMDRTFIASKLNSIPLSWNGLSNVSVLNYTFQDTDITAIPTSWNGLDNAVYMRSTFANNPSLASGGTEGFASLANVTDTNYCFGDCTAWTVDIEPLYLYLSTKSTSVTSHADMFYGCTNSTNYKYIPVEWGGLGKSKPEYITIGGRSYKTVTIGNQQWMAENLDYKFTGLTVANANNPLTKDYSAPNAAYYNYDEATYGVTGNKFGLMYNYTAAKYINDHLAELDIPDGWHVPTKAEMETMLDSIGSRYGVDYEWSPSIAFQLMSTNYWQYPGTDDYEFSAYPVGEARTQGSNYDNLGNVEFESTLYTTFFTTVTEYDNRNSYRVEIESYSPSYGNPQRVLMLYGFKHFCGSIRLVKNIT